MYSNIQKVSIQRKGNKCIECIKHNRLSHCGRCRGSLVIADGNIRNISLTSSVEAKDTLQDVARKIYTKLDHIYKTFIHRPGKFSQSLRTILDLQVRLLEAAIIDGRVECEKQCGIYEYTAISCGNCSGTVIACFGYTCSSALDWEVALRSIPEYVNELARGTAQHLLLSTEIANFSGSDTGRYVFWKPDKLFLTRKMPFVSVMKPFFTRFKSKQKKYRN
ncbi:izumo sperm-egg fusion protein 4 [Ascaphus truei]|uniref:izumo sperm-egg fusion protein 4 n=1 Tax=Ascaphus truei TaxID=8439 RepID=UPI003F5A68F2